MQRFDGLDPAFLRGLNSHAETHFYRQACDRLVRAGYDVLPIDCTDKSAEELTATIRDRLRAFFTVPDQETVR